MCHKRPWCRLRLRASSSSALATFEPDFRGQQLRLRCSRCRRWAAPWPRWKSAEEAWEGRPVPLPPDQGWIGEDWGLFPDPKISQVQLWSQLLSFPLFIFLIKSSLLWFIPSYQNIQYSIRHCWTNIYSWGICPTPLWGVGAYGGSFWCDGLKIRSCTCDTRSASALVKNGNSCSAAF